MFSQIGVWSKLLPKFFSMFEKVKDPRKPKKIKHKTAVLLMHALLLFVLDLAKPQLHENMMSLFPEFESISHGDTVGKLLQKIYFTDIEAIHVAMIEKLIKKKKFHQFLILGNLPISIDGVHKLSRDGALQRVEWLER